MIHGIPTEFDGRILEEFDFGSDEAVDDSLLSECFCEIDPINRFLENKHSILVGAKGSGKSAVFKLLKESVLYFKGTDKRKTILVTIDEKIEYESLQANLNKRLKSKITKPIIRSHYLWEIYILYRICLRIRGNNEILTGNLKKQVERICGIFETKSKNTLLNLLTASKKTIGLKLDTTNPMMPSPDFYMQAEPTSNNMRNKQIDDVFTIKIDTLKNDINECIRKNGYKLFVLVDNLDDFVSSENYKTQKKILHGVIQSSREYRRFDSVFVKLFIRTDLYRKMDFSQLGGLDKVDPHVIYLKWEPSDIRLFISLRFMHNLRKVFNLKYTEIGVDDNSIFLSEKLSLKSFFSRAFKYFLGKGPDEYDARSIPIIDQLHRTVILSFFPAEMKHYNGKG